MKRFLALSFITLSLYACSSFIVMTDKDAYQEQVITESGKTSATIHFSHNINGELYPCGCRHFPLGGIPQVAGALTKSSQSSYVLYVDTGDTFFPSTVVPEAMKRTLHYSAESLAEGLSAIGLKYFVPGDQDFAMGPAFLAKVADKAKFTFLVSNFSEQVKIKHKKWAKVILPHMNIYFIGVVDPSVYPAEYQHLFTNAEDAIENALSEIPKGDRQKIVLLSHAGMDKDSEWARKFSRLNWIIGAHSQNFLREATVVGTTNIVQTLSKNHYLGTIQIDLGSGTEKYSLVEIRDELKDELKPNPFTAFLDQHKTGLREVQNQEQNLLMSAGGSGRTVTANNCFQCHTEQNAFWQKTSHALAFGTLLTAHEEKNTQCVGCHSLKFGEPSGFSRFEDMVVFKKEEEKQKGYWKEYLSYFSSHKAVRNIGPNDKQKIARKIAKLDQKHEVTHNYAGVQCLNCHDKTNGHPFDATETISLEARKNGIKNQCMNCHSVDQSPEWYSGVGPKAKLNEARFKELYKSVSCPKRKEHE